MMKTFVASTALTLAVLLAGTTAPVKAQQVVAGVKVETAPPAPDEQPRLASPQWGSAVGVRAIHALGFTPAVDTTTYIYDGSTTHRIRTGGPFGYFDAALDDLPAGAQLVGLEIEACDTNAAVDVQVALFRIATLFGNNVLGFLSTGNAATPGCVVLGDQANLPPGQFVDNKNNKYFLRVVLNATDNTTTFGAVRVYYRLRVSPGPGAATFADVPLAHPFFPFVEALVASGITGGCGGGNYCPDTPVTRGQMAVFLAVALGLHFPF